MKKIDRFLLRDILSDGPAGTVYKADEILPGDNRRPVALKLLPQLHHNSPEEERFFGEVKALAQLAVHPHIVTLYAMGLTDGFPWLAMEFAPTTLQQKLADTPADPADVLRLVEQTARGLAAMHALKPPLIHQDLKPANLLIDAVGNYKITDFSLSTVTAANKTHGLATVRYAAPEMLSSEFGRVGPPTDLYALGHIAYEFALGQRLVRQQFPAVFEGNSTKDPSPNKWMMWHASMTMRPAPVSHLIKSFPPTLAELIARLLAKPLTERYTSAEELLADISMLHADIAPPPPTLAPTQLPLQEASVAAPRIIPAQPAPPPPTAPNPLTRYWVRLRGKTTGPFDLASLQRQIKQGAISRLHQISTDQATWKQATDIEGLYGPAVV